MHLCDQSSVPSTPPVPDIKVTFEQPSYSVSESMGMVSIRVITGSNASFPYDVVVTSTNLTANGQCTALDGS